MPPPLQNPKPTDVVSQIITAARGSVPGPQPGVVMSYNSATMRAVVKPILHNYYSTTDEAGHASEEQAPIADIPVMWPVFAEGSLIGNLQPGDRVLLVPSGRSLDEWKATNDTNIKQQDKRRHALQDAVALPVSVAAPAVGRSADGALVLAGTNIRLGSSLATSPVALSVPTDANLSLLWGLLSAAVTAPNFAAWQAAVAVILGVQPAPTPTGALNVRAL